MSVPEPDKLHPRIYWAVIILSVLWILFLYWFTQTFNLPLGNP